MPPKWMWYRVPVAEVVRYLDPLSGKRWRCDPITSEEVNRAITNGNFEPVAWDTVKDRLSGPDARDFHIRRIAYLVKHSSALEQDDMHPIMFEPDSDIATQNGNHRIAAAQIRRDERIAVKLFVSENDPEDVVLQLLPGAIAL
jgi:hypothetical protein